MNNIFAESKDILSSSESTLERVADKMLGGSKTSLEELNAPIEKKKDSNPFSSGFDKDHPMPTYDQLRNAGFCSEDAKKILYNTNHIYSSKELYHCFYESPDPVKAYKDMMSEKAKLQIEKTEDFLRRNGV